LKSLNNSRFIKKVTSRVRPAQARGKSRSDFQDEARIGQKNTLNLGVGQTGGRPAAAKDLGCNWAYVFGAVCLGSFV
jgi:hypothetical protein